MKKENQMKGINNYGKELTPEQIKNKEHRTFVGGLWDELGQLQLAFLKEQGLKPDHNLLDIGCGCLRGGIHFIRYLDCGNYYGIDVNNSLIDAGKVEIGNEGLVHKQPDLLVDDKFRLWKFRVKFDYMISVSVFTHLPINIIIRCLVEVKRSLKKNGVYYSTFFEAPHPAHIDTIKHIPGEVVTNYDADPFHYSQEELAWMADMAGLRLKIVGDWKHPRNQKMAAFTLKG